MVCINRSLVNVLNQLWDCEFLYEFYCSTFQSLGVQLQFLEKFLVLRELKGWNNVSNCHAEFQSGLTSFIPYISEEDPYRGSWSHFFVHSSAVRVSFFAGILKRTEKQGEAWRFFLDCMPIIIKTFWLKRFLALLLYRSCIAAPRCTLNSAHSLLAAFLGWLGWLNYR